MSSHQHFRDTVKLTSFQREGLLQRLDGASKVASSGAKNRKGVRFSYQRENVPMLVVHPGGGVGRFLVCTRNISEGGMSILHGGFLHVGAEAHLSVTDVDGHEQHLVGVVAQCRIVHGTLHEIGVQFRERIDVTRFVDDRHHDLELPEGAENAPVVDGDLLLLDMRSATRKTRAHQLRHCGLTVVEAASAGEAKDLLKTQPFDVVLIDCDSGIAVSDVKALRDGVFEGLMVTLTEKNELARILPSTCVRLETELSVPAIASRIAVYLSSRSSDGMEPILSELTNDPGMVSLVQGYIHDVKRSCEQITSAMAESDMQTIRGRCQAIRTTAGGYGFPMLTRAAGDALNALDATGAVEGAITELKRLISFGGRLAVRDGDNA